MLPESKNEELDRHSGDVRATSIIITIIILAMFWINPSHGMDPFPDPDRNPFHCGIDGGAQICVLLSARKGTGRAMAGTLDRQLKLRGKTVGKEEIKSRGRLRAGRGENTMLLGTSTYFGPWIACLFLSCTFREVGDVH